MEKIYLCKVKFVVLNIQQTLRRIYICSVLKFTDHSNEAENVERKRTWKEKYFYLEQGVRRCLLQLMGLNTLFPEI